MSEPNDKPRRPIAGGKQAKRVASLILETLTGVRTTQEASDVLGIALARYYVLEKRALEGMISALEPRPRGRRRSLEIEIERAREEAAYLERELARYQSLHRLSQRVVGVPPDEPAPRRGAKTKTVRARRKKSRGERILRQLAPESSTKDAPRSSRRTEAKSTPAEEA